MHDEYHGNNVRHADDVRDDVPYNERYIHKPPHRVANKGFPDDGDGAKPMPSTSLC